MAGTVWSTLYLSVAATDIASYIESHDLDEPVELQDDTTFNTSGYRVQAAGLKSWTIRCTLHQNWANGLLDDILAAANGTSVAVEYRPASAVVGVNNPKRTGNAILVYESPVSGGTPGTIARATLTLHGTGVLTRAEA